MSAAGNGSRTGGPPARAGFFAPRVLPLMIALALAAVLPYLVAGGLRTFIPFDDATYVYRNPEVLRGISWSGTRWAFTSFRMSNWHPLTWLSHMLDASLFGREPWGHHLTSVLLHGLNTALLFLSLTRLTGRLWPSALAAALFGVHPLRVESVAWVAERKDLLAGFFFALVLLAYERYARRGGAVRYLLTVMPLALGLMAKPMLVTTPLVLLLLDYWPLGRARLAPGGGPGRSRGSWCRLLGEKAPLLALSVASSVVTFLAQKHGGSVVAFPLGTRFANALVSCVGYLGKSAWPTALAMYYPHPVTVPFWKAAGACALLGAASFAATLRPSRRPAVAVGWLWFLGMLVPVIGLVQVGAQAMADRYTYLPCVGLWLLLAWGAPGLPLGPRRCAWLPATGAIVALTALFFATVVQAGRWKDGETLFRHTLAVTSKNWVIHLDLGNVLLESGRPEEALRHYRETLRYQPHDAVAYYDIAVALEQLGRPEEAFANYRQALQLRPGYREAHAALGMLLYKLGRGAEGAEHLAEARRLRDE